MLWAVLILGAWVMLSPWLMGWSGVSLMMWSNLFAGLALVLIPLWFMFGTEEKASEIKEPEDGQS